MRGFFRRPNLDNNGSSVTHWEESCQSGMTSVTESSPTTLYQSGEVAGVQLGLTL